MKDQLKYALELLADVQLELATEDSLLHGTLSQSLFDKLALASSAIERAYLTMHSEDEYRFALDFNNDDYNSIPDEAEE